jgi:hypothetical protein
MINGVPSPNQNITGIPKYDSPLSEELADAFEMAAKVERKKLELEAAEQVDEMLGVMKLVGLAAMLIMGIAAIATSYILIRFVQWVMP